MILRQILFKFSIFQYGIREYTLPLMKVSDIFNGMGNGIAYHNKKTRKTCL